MTVCRICIEYIQLCAVAVHKMHFKTKWQSCQPISHLEFLNSLFDCLVVGCLRGQYRGMQECQKVASPEASVTFGRLEELSKWGHMGISWGWPHQGKTVSLSESWGEIGISHCRESGQSWSCFCPHGPKAFRTAAAGYCSRRPARCPRLTHDHRHWRRI